MFRFKSSKHKIVLVDMSTIRASVTVTDHDMVQSVHNPIHMNVNNTVVDLDGDHGTYVLHSTFYFLAHELESLHRC